MPRTPSKPPWSASPADPNCFSLRPAPGPTCSAWFATKPWSLPAASSVAESTADLTDLVTLCRVDELEREESYRAVWSALRTLPPEQAEVVVLKIWEEMTFAQIGQILETSPNTVASRYQYAMARLTRRLASQQREVQRD